MSSSISQAIDEVRDRLTHELERSADGGVATTDLSAAVCDYVDALREAGEPPERAVAAVKALANHVLLEHTVEFDEARAILEAVVQWCIEGYYGER